MGLFSNTKNPIELKKTVQDESLQEFVKANMIIDKWDYYRDHDGPGVYTILIYEDSKVLSASDYAMSYAGQSLKVYHRVHQHLTGKGNGDIYADYRNGRHLLIRIERCEEDQLNDLEIERISQLDSKRRYNITSGGATFRPYEGEAVRNNRCRITVYREQAMFNQGIKAKIIIDGKEVAKLKMGEETKVSLREGVHRLEIKGFGMEIKGFGIKGLSDSVDLREGDKLVVKATFAGWEYQVKRISIIGFNYGSIK